MRHFIFVDNCGLLSAMPAIAQNREEVFFFVSGGEARSGCEYLPEGANYYPMDEFETVTHLKISSQDRAIIHFTNLEERKSVYNRLRSISDNLPIIIIDENGEDKPNKKDNCSKDPSLCTMSINPLLKLKSQEKWHQVEIKRKLEKLKQVVIPDEPLLILTQHDPDPDAIASAMALQIILGRNDKTAPIVTLKKVSRNENINMVNILGANVQKTTLTELDEASQIAMVDVQPAFFKREFPNIKIVVDHHPVTEDYKIPFKDLQVTYGATATIFTEYLLANENVIHQKLATALFYGIKTDTLQLGRDVSKADFNAFVSLWHKADHRQISEMERPRLKAEELDIYIKALKNHEIRSRFLFVGLGTIPKDDLVPRLADFVMQIGTTDFAVVWGQLGKDSTLSARSQNPFVHAGEVMREVFAEIGSAGGHKSMARATVPTDKLMAYFKVKSLKKLEETIKKKLQSTIAKHKKESKNSN